MAVTVTEYVPAGVPGSVVGTGLLLDPPPHPTAIADTKQMHASPSANFRRLRLAGMLSINRHTITNPPPNGSHPEGRRAGLPAVCGAVVVTVSVVLPLVGTKVGESEQVDSFIAAGTEQVKFTIPVNPLTALTVRGVDADWPALGMLKLAASAVKVKPGDAVAVEFA